MARPLSTMYSAALVRSCGPEVRQHLYILRGAMEPAADSRNDRPTGPEEGETKLREDSRCAAHGRRRDRPVFVDGSAPLEKGTCVAAILLLAVVLWTAIWGLGGLLVPH